MTATPSRKPSLALCCDPRSCVSVQTPRGDIERAANFVAWFDSLPAGLKEAIPFLTFIAIVGTVGSRVVVCGRDGAMCGGSDADWFAPGNGLGVQLQNLILSVLPS